MAVQPHRQRSAFRRFIGFWLHHFLSARQSLRDMYAQPRAALMTIAVLGLSLTLPATLYTVVKNAQQATAHLGQSSEISVYLKTNVTEADAMRLRERLLKRDDIDSIRLVLKEQGLEEFKAISGFGNALEYLDTNPLPHVFIVLPKPDYQHVEAAMALLQALKQENQVAQARLDVEWLARLQALMRLFRHVLVALGILLSITVVLIVSNTIRLMILNREDEIIVMKLVGATENYIQRPFLYTGFWYGLCGGVLAWCLTASLLWWLNKTLNTVMELYDSPFVLTRLNGIESFGLLACAIVLGLVGSFWVVRRHIALIEPQ